MSLMIMSLQKPALSPLQPLMVWLWLVLLIHHNLTTAGGTPTDVTATTPGSVTVVPKSTSIDFLLDKYHAEGP